jgi:hypothetical protein
MWDRISELWCRSMHDKAMWPMHGKYTCPDCLREYPVVWEDIPRGPETAPPPRPASILQFFGWLKRFGTM